MKVIIVEVTRAANTFGQTHLPEIRKAYDRIADIVAAAQADGTFRDAVTPEFAAMAFYGAIEQVLTGWIFGLLEEERGRLRAGQALRRGDDLRRVSKRIRRARGLDSRRDDGQRHGQATDVVGPARGARRAGLDRDDEGSPT